jgi:hypothetical protein
MKIKFVTYDEIIQRDTDQKYDKDPCTLCCFDPKTCKMGSRYRYQGCHQGIFIKIGTKE